MNKKAKKQARIESAWNVSDTIQAVLVHNLEYLQEWEQAARNWDDIEGVHQTRVTFRRMRSALNIFRPVIPKEVSLEWGDAMRDLAGRLGPARDLDVFITEGLGDIGGKIDLPGGAKLSTLVHQARADAYRDVVAMLDSDGYARFKQGFAAWCRNRDWERADLKKKQRQLLHGTTMAFARKILDRQERRVLEAGTHVDKYNAEAMHRLRIECKKLRYAAEFFLPIFPGMGDFIDHMKGLQDLLGVMNDVAVTRQLLHQVMGDARDPHLCQYAGGIVGWRTCHYHELLNGFELRWDEFVEAKHPWWKKHSGTQPGDESADQTP